MIKKFFLKNIFFFIIFFFHQVYASIDNKIIVKVDDKIISLYELKNKINTEIVLRNLEMNQENIDQLKPRALQTLIKLRLKEIEIAKFSSNNLEKINISRQLQNISSNNLEELRNKFYNNNLDYDIFLKELKIQTAWQQLIFKLYGDKVVIDENELIKLANKFKNKSELKEYDLSEIIFSFENENEKNNKIQDVKQKLKKVGFEETLKIFSESDTVANNGRLGLVSENSLSKNIFEKLKNLQEGEISEPIISSNKVLFLKINKILSSKNQDINIKEIKKNIENKKKGELLRLYSESHLSKIKNSSYIEFK